MFLDVAEYVDPFRDTPLEQSVVSFLRPNSIKAYQGAYQPRRVMCWNFGAPNFKFERSMFLHEVCHIIEVWVNKDRAKLCLPGFGFTQDKITLAGVRTEAWTQALEFDMGIDLFGHNSSRSDYSLEEYDYSQFYETMKKLGVDLPQEKWSKILAKESEKVRSRDLSYYYKAWHDAVAYIDIYAPRDDREEDIDFYRFG